MDRSFDEISNSQKPVELVRSTTDGEQLIVFCARVSNPNNQSNFTTAPKLIKYLLDNKHFSPFEMASATIQIRTSRAIAAQILRHRSFTFQEFSQRYAQAFDYVEYDARRQDQKNRQNSVDDMGEEDKDWFLDAQARAWTESKDLYDEAIKRGIAKEQARFLLPLNTATTIYMTGSIRSWIHYVQLRSSNGTQKEHADIAIECRNVLIPIFPDVSAALGWA
jgi:thymidylate synthase (FAD)